MASPILTRIISTAPLRIINNGVIVWNKLRTEKVEIISDSQMSDNPFATSNLSTIDKVSSSSQADLLTAKVIMPTSLKVTMICDDISTLLGIISLYYDVTHQLDIISKEIYSANMSMTNISLDQSPECLSATRVVIDFEQTKIVDLNEYNASQNGDKSTYGIRIIPGSDIPSNVQELYNRIKNVIGL